MRNAIAVQLLAVAVLFMTREAVALAYFDPSTGGLLVQVLGTAVAVASGVALMFSRQIRLLLGRLRRHLRPKDDERL